MLLLQTLHARSPQSKIIRISKHYFDLTGYRLSAYRVGGLHVREWVRLVVAEEIKEKKSFSTSLIRHLRRGIAAGHAYIIYIYYNMWVGFCAYSFQKYFVLYSFSYWKMYVQNMTCTCWCFVVCIYLCMGEKKTEIYSNKKTNNTRTHVIYCRYDVFTRVIWGAICRGDNVRED